MDTFDDDHDGYLNFAEMNNLLEAGGAVPLQRPAFDDLCLRFSDEPHNGLSVNAIRRLHSSQRASPTESGHSVMSIRSTGSSTPLSDGMHTPEIPDVIPGTPPLRPRAINDRSVRKASSNFESADDASSIDSSSVDISQDRTIQAPSSLRSLIPNTSDSTVFASPPLLGQHQFRITRSRAIASKLRKEKWKATNQSTEEILRLRLEPAPAYVLGEASLERLWRSFRGLPSETVLPTTWTPPAEMMAQESELQRIASMFGWSSLLADACKGTDPLSRVLRVASFLLAAFHETSDFSVLAHQAHPGEVYRCGYEYLKAVSCSKNHYAVC